MGAKDHSIGKNLAVILFTDQSHILMGALRLKVCSDTAERLHIRAPFLGLSETSRSITFLFVL